MKLSIPGSKSLISMLSSTGPRTDSYKTSREISCYLSNIFIELVTMDASLIGFDTGKLLTVPNPDRSDTKSSESCYRIHGYFSFLFFEELGRCNTIFLNCFWLVWNVSVLHPLLILWIQEAVRLCGEELINYELPCGCWPLSTSCLWFSKWI